MGDIRGNQVSKYIWTGGKGGGVFRLGAWNLSLFLLKCWTWWCSPSLFAWHFHLNNVLLSKKKKKINSMREQSPKEPNNERTHKTKAQIWLSAPHSFHCLCSGRTPLIFGLSVALQVKSLATAIATCSVLDVECMASSLLPLAGGKLPSLMQTQTWQKHEYSG